MSAKTGLCIEDLSVGQSATYTKTVTEADIVKFADISGDDLAAWAAADDLFHRTLIERCGNGRIARIAGTIMDQAHRARMLTLRLRTRPDGAVAQHQAIIDAIAAGDAAAARRAAREHRVLARDELLPLLAHLGIRHL